MPSRGLALLLAAASVACDAGQPDVAASEAPRPPLECSQLALADSSAQPLDAVGVRGVPDGFDGVLYAEVRTPSDSLTGYAPVEHTDGAWVLRAPIHPGGSPEGGAVEVQFTDGELRCSPVPFTIQALPEAPGTFAAVVDALDEVIRLQAGRFGVAPQALHAADPDTLAPYLLPLLVTRRAIDHPQGLRAWADGTAPVLDTLPEGRDLLNRLLAQIGLADALEAYASELRGGAESPAFAPGASFRSGHLPTGETGSLFHFAAYPIHPPRSALLGLSSHAAPEPGILSCTAITTAEVLDFCMGEAASAAFGQTHAGGKVLGDLGLVAGLAGFINPAVGTAAGFVIWVMQTGTEGVANLLPSSFVSLKVKIGPTAFEEDYPFNRNPPGPGEWQARVAATSKGWTLEKFVFEAALQALAGKGMYDAYLKRLTPDAADFAMDMWNYILGNVTQEAINSVTGLPGSTGTALTIEPETYGPIDISDEAWSDQRLVTGQAVEWIDHGKYVPHMVDGALVEIRTKDGRFGGRQIRSDHVAVDVRQIRVILSPDQRFVDPGETVVLQARVEDAVDTGLEVEASAGTAITTRLGDGEYEITFTAPLDEGAFDVILTARSTSTLGLRGRPDAPPRFDIATIELNQFEVLPATACVAPGDSLQFTALLGGERTTEVRWSASAGRISGSGDFREHGGNGTATITAASSADPDLKAEATVSYGERCESWYELTSSGDVSLSQEGPMWSIMGIPSGRAGEDLCIVNISVAAPSSAPDQFFTLSAALPNGLQAGRYAIARGYTSVRTGSAGERSSLIVPRSTNFSTQRENPGVFYAGSELGNYTNTRLRGDNRLTGGGEFISESGSTTVRRLEGNRVHIAFHALLLETGSEGEQIIDGAHMSTVYYPLRRIVVEGQISHTLSSSSRNIWNSYQCEPIDPDSSEASG